MDKVKGRSPERLKSLIKVPNVAHLRVQAVSRKKVKSLIEVPYVAILKEQFPSFNMNLFSSP